MLNSVDRKLIRALQQNGRATHVELSKQLGLHVSTIAKKMQLLEAGGVMQIRALPNPYKLGYLAHAVLAMETDHHKTDDICSRLYDNFNVNLLVTTFGRFDVIAIVFFPTWEKLLDFVSSYLSPTNGILNVETYFVKEIKKRYYGFPIIVEPPVKIDEVDQRLIEKLTENGRHTAQFLAQELGISLPTCLKKLSFLIKEKVIEIKAVPNQSETGFIAYAFMLLRVQAAKLEEVCATLSACKDIFLILSLFNGYDVMIGVNAASPETLYGFIKNGILAIDGVVNGKTIIRAEIKKRYYGGFIGSDDAATT